MLGNYLIFGVVVFAAALLVISIVFLQEKRKDASAKAKKEASIEMESEPAKRGWKRHFWAPPARSVLEQLPIQYYDAKGYYVLKDGSNLDLLMIQSKDLVTSSPDEVEFDCLKFGKLYKIYGNDLKLVSLNFPCNTLHQQLYFKQKMVKAGNEVYRHWLQKKLKELEALEKTHTTREFYLMFDIVNIG